MKHPNPPMSMEELSNSLEYVPVKYTQCERCGRDIPSTAVCLCTEKIYSQKELDDTLKAFADEVEREIGENESTRRLSTPEWNYVKGQNDLGQQLHKALKDLLEKRRIG